MNVSRKQKVQDHIVRLKMQNVDYMEFKGALEAFSAVGLMQYTDCLHELDIYKLKELNKKEN